MSFFFFFKKKKTSRKRKERKARLLLCCVVDLVREKEIKRRQVALDELRRSRD